MRRGGLTQEASPLLNITAIARKMLDEFASSSDEQSLALKIEIVGRGKNGFQYDLQLVPKAEAEQDDEVTEIDGWTVLIAKTSVPYMDGVTLDYKEKLMGGGFHFDNPNPLWADEMSKNVQATIDEHVNPTIASHGGSVSLLSVKDGDVTIVFGGGCQGCAAVDITLKNGVEKILKEKVPEIKSIIDATNHEAGSNPFY